MWGQHSRVAENPTTHPMASGTTAGGTAVDAKGRVKSHLHGTTHCKGLGPQKRHLSLASWRLLLPESPTPRIIVHAEGREGRRLETSTNAQEMQARPHPTSTQVVLRPKSDSVFKSKTATYGLTEDILAHTDIGKRPGSVF